VTTAVAARTTAYRGKIDQICADAVDLARAAVTEDVAGPHIEAIAEGERLVTHYFECTMAGYRGWRWAVTLARTSRSKQVTICETVLLPGPDALTTPDWVPWNERVQPGDLGVGDLMPTAPDDDRLVPGYLLSEDPAVEDVVWELGLGRVRVMSREGRLDAAERWYDGDAGPQAPIATAAPAHARCVSCGFFLPLAGSMRALFGACANMYAPDDGRVVANDHGCGAHSEVLIEQIVEVDETPTIYDDAEVEPVVDLASAVHATEVPADVIIAESSTEMVTEALPAADLEEPVDMAVLDETPVAVEMPGDVDLPAVDLPAVDLPAVEPLDDDAIGAEFADAPVSADVPDTDVPDTDVPDTDVPDADVPDADVPDTAAAYALVADAPAATDAPAGDAPAGDAPAEDDPAEDAPAEDTFVEPSAAIESAELEAVIESLGIPEVTVDDNPSSAHPDDATGNADELI
jgi:DUF3027 family protein